MYQISCRSGYTLYMGRSGYIAGLGIFGKVWLYWRSDYTAVQHLDLSCAWSVVSCRMYGGCRNHLQYAFNLTTLICILCNSATGCNQGPSFPFLSEWMSDLFYLLALPTNSILPSLYRQTSHHFTDKSCSPNKISILATSVRKSNIQCPFLSMGQAVVHK